MRTPAIRRARQRPGRYREPVPRYRLRLLLASLGMALLTSCTSGSTLGSSGTVALTSRQVVVPTTAATPTSVSPTPVTPNGLITGAGVDDSTITLGLLVEPTLDRGFSSGVALWTRSVNTSGGICGRTVRTEAGTRGEPLPAAYSRVAGSSLGLITLPAQPDAARLDALTSADEMPTLTLTGSSAKLRTTGPVVIGATEDIKAINALAYLRSNGKLLKGSTLQVLTDSSDTAANALAGAAWWAQANGVTLVSRIAGSSLDHAFDDAGAVLVIADPAQVKSALAGAPPTADVITNLDGYDPARLPDPAGRLLVTSAAPAFGSDSPGAAAVAKAFVASSHSEPGPNLMSGYGVGAAWGRLLVEACDFRKLTHTGISTAMNTVGPAPVDSLFGPADPGLVVATALPATRVSSVALADPKAPAGLRPLIWLQAAPGIADYQPAK